MRTYMNLLRRCGELQRKRVIHWKEECERIGLEGATNLLGALIQSIGKSDSILIVSAFVDEVRIGDNCHCAELKRRVSRSERSFHEWMHSHHHEFNLAVWEILWFSQKLPPCRTVLLRWIEEQSQFRSPGNKKAVRHFQDLLNHFLLETPSVAWIGERE